MIRRIWLLVISPILLIISLLVLLVFLGEFVDDLKGKEIATVHLKPGVAEGDTREGEVSKKDKYVIIKSESHGEEIYTWDQIRFISGKDKTVSSKRVEQSIELVELLSKLGIAATVIVFLIGLYQYDQGQKWKREEFLANAAKEFSDRTPVSNAAKMLDSLALYPEGREVRLFPEEETRKDQFVFVSNEEIYKALTTMPDRTLDSKAIAIRDCFDQLLSYLVGFYHYLEQNLITKQGLMNHVGYWIEILGTGNDLSCRYKKRIFAYAHKYKFYEVEKLIRKYHKDFNWKTLPCSEEEQPIASPKNGPGK